MLCCLLAPFSQHEGFVLLAAGNAQVIPRDCARVAAIPIVLYDVHDLGKGHLSRALRLGSSESKRSPPLQADVSIDTIERHG